MLTEKRVKLKFLEKILYQSSHQNKNQKNLNALQT
jgi:hypothetical protein